MQKLLKIVSLSVLSLLMVQMVQAQKKVKTFKVSKIIPYSADQVWAVVGEDYGAIANSHPRIISSEYINGSLKAGEGAERVCNFNDKGTQYLKEKMVNYDPDNRTFINQVYQAGKFPVDEELTRAVYKVEAVSATSSRLTFDMQFRTKPAFMGGMMKGSFKKLINDYFIAIEHHIKTGEKVSRDNFKDIRKMYASKS
ncbi:MAG: SRPBCC family protein [Bacteroidota bacterium]